MHTKFILVGFLFFAAAGRADTIEIPGYFGDSPLKVEIAANGDTRIQAYPASWAGQLKTLQFPTTGWVKDLSDESCKGVADEVNLYADTLTPPIAKKHLFDKIRSENSVVVSLDGARAFQNGFLIAAIRAALKEKSSRYPTIRILNPIQWTSAKVIFDLKDNALVAKVGSVESVRAELEAYFQGGLINGGEGVGEIRAVDLLCDLAQNRAQIRLQLKGTQGDALQSRLLASLANARELVAVLARTSARFTVGGARGEFGRNRIMAALIANEVLKEPYETTAFLVERLTDPFTGRPLPETISDEELEERVTLYEQGTVPFEGVSKVRLPTKGGA